MVIPDDYKKTEIGIIPEDWSVVPFEKTFSVLHNNTMSRAELNYYNGDIQNIHYGDVLIKYPFILDCSKETIPYINDDRTLTVSKGFLQDGDIIISDTAEDEVVGKATEIVNVNGRKVVSGLHTIPCRAKDKNTFALSWLGYYINSRFFHDQIIPYITGIKVSSISKNSLFKTLVAYPKKSEQERIVSALSDIDTLIDNLEKLISKKKNIKQGAMQELLTGKRRLPGFDGEWIESTILDASCLVLNGDRSERYPSKDEFISFGIPFINAGHLQNGKVNFHNMDYISESHYISLSGAKLKPGDILLCLRGSLGKYAFVDFSKGAPASSLCVIRCSEVLNNRLIYYIIGSRVFRDLINKANSGSSQPNLSADTVSKFKISFPKDIKEQIAIAELLSDMDNEIEELEKKLAKYRCIKQGMMSELLSGHIRLTEKEGT